MDSPKALKCELNRVLSSEVGFDFLDVCYTGW